MGRWASQGLFSRVRVMREPWCVRTSRLAVAGGASPESRGLLLTFLPTKRCWSNAKSRCGRECPIAGRLVLGVGLLPRGRTTGGRDAWWCDRLAEDVEHDDGEAMIHISPPQGRSQTREHFVDAGEQQRLSITTEHALGAQRVGSIWNGRFAGPLDGDNDRPLLAGSGPTT